MLGKWGTPRIADTRKPLFRKPVLVRQPQDRYILPRWIPYGNRELYRILIGQPEHYFRIVRTASSLKDGSIRMEEALTACEQERRRRRSRQRGNSVVEMAMVILPTFVLVLGTIDYGVALFIKSTFQNAVREGVRYAVTFQTQGGNCMDDSIRLVVQTYALGFLGNTTTPNRDGIAVKYYNPANLSVEVAGANGNFPGNIVEVSITNFQWKWISLLSGTYTLRDSTRLSIIAYSSDRLGGLPGGALPPCR